MKESLLMALWVGFLFVSLGITARLLRRSWLAPGAFFTLYWSIAAVSPLIFSPYEKVSAGAVMWIFFSTLAVFSGDLVGALSRKNEQQVKENVLFSASQISFISVIVIFCSIVGMVSFVIIFNSAAQNLSLLSVQDFVAVARKIADTRYTRAYKPFLTQFLNMFLYAGPLFGGLLVGIENRRRYLIIAALPMLPAVLMTAIFILRGFIIISILLWIGSYLGTRVLVGSQQLFTKRHLVLGLTAVILLFIIVIGARFARTGFRDTRSIPARSYAEVCKIAFGHMAVFSNWFDRTGLQVKSPLPGAYTFAGVFNLLGIRKREVGLFTETVTLSNGAPSNIYTVFRVLIEDFTPLGSLVLLFLIGLLASRIYLRLVQGRARALPILVAFYASVLWSFITCIWIWNSIIAAFILFTIGFLIMLELPNLKESSNSLFSHLGTWYSPRNKLKR
jgi:oligosaccharide repeat unit polymerase